LYQNGLDYDEELLVKIKKYVHPWVIDIWSLGCIILEILHGVPVWMSLKTKVDNTDKYSFGLFAVKGRKFENIIAKQIQVVQRIDQILNN
jgi:dual specificity tyrosine-phosphorylation-regulated kinase 2/3/4